MNYDRPELLDQLAAAYVLGVLRHRARSRFARLCASSSAAQRATRGWEDRLLPLALQLPPQTPSNACWAGIQRRIAEADAGSGARGSGRHRSRRWRLAIAASLIAVALLLGRELLSPSTVWRAVAVLAPANAQPLWRVELDANATRLNVHVIGSITLTPSQSYELWALPVASGKPVSLGLLPRQGRLERTLTPAQREILLVANKVAVSVEPSGGSPTGLPTGPVVIVAAITRST